MLLIVKTVLVHRRERDALARVTLELAHRNR